MLVGRTGSSGPGRPRTQGCICLPPSPHWEMICVKPLARGWGAPFLVLSWVSGSWEPVGIKVQRGWGLSLPPGLTAAWTHVGTHEWPFSMGWWGFWGCCVSLPLGHAQAHKLGQA